MCIYTGCSCKRFCSCTYGSTNPVTVEIVVQEVEKVALFKIVEGCDNKHKCYKYGMHVCM